MYAKMCMEANLDWTPQVGMWIVQKGNFGNRGVIFSVSDESIWAGNSYSPDPCVFKNTSEFIKKDFFPLWSQRQLQEMSDLSWWKFDERCNDIWRVLLEDPFSEIEVKTKEQAGICVLMEKYHKFWNGKKWIEDAQEYINKLREEWIDGGS